MNPPPDAALIAAVRDGDAEAWERLVRAWGPVVLGWCARLDGNLNEAEDLAQGVFLAVLAHIGDLRDPKAFPAWLYQVTRRTVTRHRQRAWFRRIVLPWTAGEDDAIPAPDGDPLEDAARDQVARAVLEILAGLPVKFREVLVLCELESRTEAEAAELVGVPLGTVKSRLRRAREAFAIRARRSGLLDDEICRLQKEFC